MIEKNRHTGGFDATCDSCSINYLEVEADDFREAVQEIKKQGWRVFKNDDDEWVHHCSDCGLK